MRVLTLPAVFAPIGDSWMLARAVRSAAWPGARVLDLCTGSGVVAVAGALAGADVTAVDVSRRAVACAWLNARLNGVRVRARRGDLLAAVASERFDVISANPPYVPSADALPARGARRAWDAGRDGRALLERVLDEAPAALAPGGVLLVVHSDLIDADATLERLRAAGLDASVAARERGPLGPLMRARAREGLIPPRSRDEELLVLRGRA